MKIFATDNNNINYKAKLKPPKYHKTKVSNKIVSPVIMGALTAQLLKEQTLNSSLGKLQYTGYLNKKLTNEEAGRGEKLANCFNFFKDQKQVLFNIMTLLTTVKRNINDMFFIKNFFDFLESDELSFKVKNVWPFFKRNTESK